MIRIPAIDIINGTCVRLTKGEFDQSTMYNTDPVEIAKKYEKAGAKKIHIVDLDAARGIRSNKEIIYQIAEETNLEVQTGGGIKSKDQIESFFEHGVQAVIIGSKAVSDRDEVKSWIKHYGGNRIIIGADVRNRKIAIDGWLSTSEEDISDFILDYTISGADTFLCTDIQKDGMLEGTSNTLYNLLRVKFPDVKLIASGGVSCMEDLELLEEMEMYACVIGKALFENRIDLNRLF
ncbi:MAG: phosphoribosylformimino-5-aminoimidazole carboxamide ribotide isomerase [Saprospiraceae bacterium]|jgi:phosphoribosylformimino-5-aminoimidazole carboxamide ribotide isomerase|tara:strand:+ start:937 stop:1641 length:705 start_codon:yes stop_codon:yes gene_type:complete